MKHAQYEDYQRPLSEFTADAWERHETSTCDLQIAGQKVRLTSSHAPLIDTLIPAIAHLKTEEAHAQLDFEICLIDLSRIEGKKLPSIPWEPLLKRGHRGLKVGDVYLQFVHILETGVRILSAYDSRNNRAYYFVSSTEQLPWYIMGAPMHEILYWWVRSKDMHILHCGVVGNSDGGVALLGAKGAGKSTMVLNCLERGFQYISEDYCIVTNDAVPVAYSLYNSAKFTDFTFHLFPHLASFKANDGGEAAKILVFYQDIYPDQIVREVPLKALVSLNLQSDGGAGLSPIDMHQTFLDMISSTTLQNPVYELSSTAFFHDLKQKLPSFEMTHDGNLEESHDLLLNLLRKT